MFNRIIFGFTYIIVLPHLITSWQRKWEKIFYKYNKKYPTFIINKYDYILDPQLYISLFIGHQNAKERYILANPVVRKKLKTDVIINKIISR